MGMAPAELPMPKQIDVVFNHNARSRYRSPLTGEWRNGDDMEAWLIEAIDGATEEVLVAVQELSLPKIAQAARRDDDVVTADALLALARGHLDGVAVDDAGRAHEHGTAVVLEQTPDAAGQATDDRGLPLDELLHVQLHALDGEAEGLRVGHLQTHTRRINHLQVRMISM